jgi:16S rRNA (adenine1518-N6/adenine1519-N6)-dimethyltransferase
MVQGRTEIKDLLAAHGLKPRRSLGQNFLADPNLIDRIVRTAGVGAGDEVVEVGAGTGTLTRALAATGARVVAYEIDRGLLALLDSVLEGTDVEVRGEDVTRVDLNDALDTGPWTMVANLPYNVGTPLVLDVLRNVPRVTRLVVMVQREVADRFLAGPGTRLYGVPSVVVALHAEARLEFKIPRDVFYPMPDVESALVNLTRVAAPGLAGAAIELAGVAFRQRRKMLRRSLAGVLDDPQATLGALGIDDTARPEQLTPEDFLRIAGATT